MKSLLHGLFITSGAVVLAVGALVTVERLLADPHRRRVRPAGNPESPAAPQPSIVAPERSKQRNFSIKRTKSEVGFVYWILEGYGAYKCFILCDTWDEAVAQAQLKMAETGASLRDAKIPVLSST